MALDAGMAAMPQESQTSSNGQTPGTGTLAQEMPSLQSPSSITSGQLAPSIEVGSLPAQSSLNSLNVQGALSPSLSFPVGAIAIQGSTTPSMPPAASINTSGLSVPVPSAGSMPGLLPSLSSSASVPGVGLLGDAQLSLPTIPAPSSLPMSNALPTPAIAPGLGGLVRGTLFHVADGGTYGFVKPDGGGADVFAMPPLSGFPLAGSRVVCNLVFDQNLPGKMRAENIQLESNLAAVSQQVPVQPSLTALDPLAGLGAASLASLPTAGTGVLPQPQLQPQAAVLTTAAPAISAQSLLASVTAAAETQALTALLSAADPTLQAVLTQQLLAGATLQSLQGLNASTTASVPVNANGRQGGTMRHIQSDGKFGFIKPDHGGADVLALPPSAGFPAIGARVTFDVIADDKTGRPKADNLEAVVNEIGTATPLDLSALGVGGFGPALLAATNALRSSPFPTATPASQKQQGPVTQPGDNVLHGAISKVSAKFAFIRQDSGEADMFVIPPACEAFGRELPPVGTRVQYKVILDSKSGRPRADCVGPSLAPHLG